MIKTLSLKTKLILAFSLVAVISIASIVIYANLDSTRQVNNYMMRGGVYGLDNLVLRLEKYYQAEGTWEGVEHAAGMGQMMMSHGSTRGGANRVALLNANRKVIWSALSTITVGDILQPKDVNNALVLKDNAGETIGFLVVENASPVTINDISPFISRLRGVILIAGLLAAVAAIGMAVLIADQLLKPVKALTQAAGTLSAGDLSTRVEVEGTDELAVLGRTFNHMAANLESDEERKKALTADIAHELRTPLAVQRAQIEAMMDGVIPLDRDNLQTVANQAEFLTRMVEDLRLLAMADAGELKLELQKVQVEELVQKVIDQFKIQAQNDGTEVIFAAAENVRGVSMTTDPVRLTQIIHNLIANAFRYGKKGGRIEIDLNGNDKEMVLLVKDDGKGIPDEALPHIFERFYRHEKARDRETGGSGLGLSISKKLAVLLGGDLAAANHPGGGGIFTLTILDKVLTNAG